MSRVDLHFANASCAHCARLVSRSLEKLEGVRLVNVDPSHQRITVGFDPSLVTVDSIRSMMERTGYPTRLLAERVTPFPPRPLSSSRAA